MWRNEAFRRLVAAQPCVNCGVVGKTQAAHSNLAEHGKGKSVKASDAALMSLCYSACHPELDQGGSMTRAEREAFTHKAIASTYIQLMEAGLLHIAKGADPLESRLAVSAEKFVTKAIQFVASVRNEHQSQESPQLLALAEQAEALSNLAKELYEPD